jgi:hypothetical protein
MSGAFLTSDRARKDSKGQPHDLEIWRIEKFKVKFIPREQHGNFFSGDSYLVLHTYKEEDKIKWDLHFWLGKDTTQDEAGTAAYKTVELDTILDDGPVQHREVQGHESERFLNIFSQYFGCGGIRYQDGGVDSGFRHVEPEKYTPRLLHVKGKKRVRVQQVPVSTNSLNSGDVFIYDGGLKIVCWTGKEAGMFEKNKGREVCDSIKTERKGKVTIVNIREGDTDNESVEFYKALGGTTSSKIKTATEGGKDDDETETYAKNFVRKLYRLSDASGSLKMTLEKEKSFTLKHLDPKDVFIVDSGEKVFAWVGDQTTQQEKDNAIKYATDYLKQNNRPPHVSVTRVLSKAQPPQEFLACFD